MKLPLKDEMENHMQYFKYKQTDIIPVVSDHKNIFLQ